MSLLKEIKHPNDIKQIADDKLDELASEIRSFIIEKVSENGGHLAANLGVVELTMALHRCMDFPEDKLIFDVGHQAYTHKILTGRRKEFSTLRKQGGLSGFPKRRENECDAFDTGHSSTSISAAVGLAAARDLSGGSEKICAVIGDGSMTGGMGVLSFHPGFPFQFYRSKSHRKSGRPPSLPPINAQSCQRRKPPPRQVLKRPKRRHHA